MTLVLWALKSWDNVEEYGRMDDKGGFEGRAKAWYEKTMKNFTDAPKELPAFIEWAGKRFNGRYFFAELKRD